MTRRSSNEGLHSEPLRAALASALAGKPAALEDLLGRLGDGHGARPNLRLAAAFGAEISALPGIRRACSIGSARTMARPTRPRCSSRSPPRTGGSGGCRPIARSARPGRRSRRWRATNGRPFASARWMRWHRSPGVLVAGARCWRRRSTGWTSSDREIRFGAAGVAVEVFANRQVLAAVADPETLLDYLSRAIAAIADAPRSRSDRTPAAACCSRCRGRWPAWRPGCARASAAPPGWRSAGTPATPTCGRRCRRPS